MAVFSIGLSAKMVMRFGTKLPIVVGMSIIALGLLLFAFAPQDANFIIHVLPGMLLLGLGAGMAFNPVLLAGMSDIPENEAGLASGVLNTAFMMGGSLGLAILVSLAAFRTEQLVAGGGDQLVALLGGYHLAFVAGAIFAALAAVVAIVFLKESETPQSANVLGKADVARAHKIRTKIRTALTCRDASALSATPHTFVACAHRGRTPREFGYGGVFTFDKLSAASRGDTAVWFCCKRRPRCTSAPRIIYFCTLGAQNLNNR
jgi:MFS family permease